MHKKDEAKKEKECSMSKMPMKKEAGKKELKKKHSHVKGK